MINITDSKRHMQKKERDAAAYFLNSESCFINLPEYFKTTKLLDNTYFNFHCSQKSYHARLVGKNDQGQINYSV